jgi:hypothetical protein
MRIGPGKLLLALSFSPFLLPQTASAQAPASAATPVPACTCPAPTPPLQHFQPYIAKSHRTHIQTRPDGTAITTFTEGQVWRDADGRTRNETFFTQPSGTVLHSANIYDPVTRIQMSWIVDNPSAAKIVTVRHRPQPVSQPASAVPQTAQRYYPARSESLPPQIIDGLYSTGNRTTRIIPTGYEGNDQDITMTTETWTAYPLGIQLRNISDDPRTGKDTFEITDIQQSAPDPSLFKAPEGYQVNDTYPTATACTCPTAAVQQQYQPYSIKSHSARFQTLADGTHITTVTTSQVWRDADGRTRQETYSTLNDGTPSHFISIYDPAAHVRMTWTVDNPNMAKVVNVYRDPQPVVQPVTTVQPTAQRYYPTSNQSLPPQTIDGIYVTGSRNTRTIPAGYAGNDRDITTTTEGWMSQTLGIELRYITDDPRTGKQTTEVTDIQQTAPDPALFQPPEGYQVKETNP